MSSVSTPDLRLARRGWLVACLFLLGAVACAVLAGPPFAIDHPILRVLCLATHAIPGILAAATVVAGLEPPKRSCLLGLTLLAIGLLGGATLSALEVTVGAFGPALPQQMSWEQWLLSTGSTAVVLFALLGAALLQSTQAPPLAACASSVVACAGLSVGLAVLGVRAPPPWLLDDGGRQLVAGWLQLACALGLAFTALAAATLFWRTGASICGRPAATLLTTATAALGLAALASLVALLLPLPGLPHLHQLLQVVGAWLAAGAVVRLRLRDPLERTSLWARDLDSLIRERSAVLDNVTVGVCFVRDGRFVLVNRAMESLFGSSATAMVGQPTERFVRDVPHVSMPSAEVSTRFERDLAFDDVLELKLATGGQRVFRVHGRPLIAGLPSSGSIWCFTDETERYAASARMTQALAEASVYASALEELRRLNDRLLACRSEAEAWPLVARSAALLFPSRGYLAVEREALELVEVVASWGNWGDSLPTAYPADACWALRGAHAQDLTPSDPRVQCEHVSELPEGGYSCVPLVVQGRRLALLYLELPPSTDAAQQQGWRRLVDAFAATVKSTISTLRLRGRLQEQASRDALTGLLNRRSLDEALPRELHRARRSNEPLSVAMVDADHFKRLNDTFGHEAGDAVLQRLGGLLRERLRGSDLACRFGGEEFVIVMPGTTARQAVARLDKLREEIGAEELRHLGLSLGRVSVSVGVAQWPDHGLTQEELLRRADQALYRAKASGRDRCCVAHAASQPLELDVQVQVDVAAPATVEAPAVGGRDA